MAVSKPPSRSFLADPPLFFAHRGGAALFPENTLAAFRGALDLGCRYLEMDVHATRDGVLVIHHDDRVDRTTDGTGFIRDHTLSELRRLDAGYRFSKDGAYPYRGKGLVVPTFEEVIALDEGLRVNVEIKQRKPDIVRRVFGFIQAHRLFDRILVAAAYDPLVRAFRRESRGTVATSAGANEARLFWASVRAGLCRVVPVHYDALQVPVRSGVLTVVNADFVRKAHERGIQVHVWTVDHPTEMRALLALGVDGLMSDRPDLFSSLGTGA